METIELKISNVFENLEEFSKRLTIIDLNVGDTFEITVNDTKDVNSLAIILFNNLHMLTVNGVFDYTLSDVDAIEEVWMSNPLTLLEAINTKQNNELLDNYKNVGSPMEEVAVIEITLDELDERGRRKIVMSWDVNYQIGDVEITGTIKENNGRPEFEPDEFIDTESEEYWDNDWENITEQILNAWYNNNLNP